MFMKYILDNSETFNGRAGKAMKLLGATNRSGSAAKPPTHSRGGSTRGSRLSGFSGLTRTRRKKKKRNHLVHLRPSLLAFYGLQNPDKVDPSDHKLSHTDNPFSSIFSKTFHDTKWHIISCFKCWNSGLFLSLYSVVGVRPFMAAPQASRSLRST